MLSNIYCYCIIIYNCFILDDTHVAILLRPHLHIYTRKSSVSSSTRTNNRRPSNRPTTNNRPSNRPAHIAQNASSAMLPAAVLFSAAAAFAVAMVNVGGGGVGGGSKLWTRAQVYLHFVIQMGWLPGPAHTHTRLPWIYIRPFRRPCMATASPAPITVESVIRWAYGTIHCNRFYHTDTLPAAERKRHTSIRDGDVCVCVFVPHRRVSEPWRPPKRPDQT